MNTRHSYPYWMVLPALLLYIVFFLLPALMGVMYAFTDWNRNSQAVHFVGLSNYREIFQSSRNYGQGIQNTLKFTLISNVLKLSIGLLLAIILQRGIRGMRVYRTILYLPAILPFLVIGILFTSILNYRDGLLNQTLQALGLGFLRQRWISDLNIVWKSIYGVDAWRGIGYVMTIFLAGLNAIPYEFYEAAEIDGANAWQRLRHVTLPMLTGAITINLVFGITYGLKVFDVVYILTNGGPGHATEVMTTYAFKLYASGNYALSSALNTILFAITLCAGVLIVRYMSRQEVHQ